MISFKKTKNGHIFRPEVNFFKNFKTYLHHLMLHLPWKFQVNPSSHLWEIAGTKNRKKNNNKQYNHYKVFRLKRKTLIIIVRNRVKTICSQTSFGEHNKKKDMVCCKYKFLLYILKRFSSSSGSLRKYDKKQHFYHGKIISQTIWKRLKRLAYKMC